MKRLTVIIMILGLVAAACGQGEGPIEAAAPEVEVPAAPAPVAIPAPTPPAVVADPADPALPEPATGIEPIWAEELELPTGFAPVVQPEPDPEPAPPAFVGTVDPVHGDGAPGSTAVTHARLARQEGFDRFVIEFKRGISDFDVLYAEGPFVDLPGNAIPVAGDAFLWVHLWHAAPAEFIDEEPFYVWTYEGDWRTRSDTLNVEEAVITYAFENDMEWAIGVRDQQPFRVLTLANPPRLVVDILHGDLAAREEAPPGWSFWASARGVDTDESWIEPIATARLGGQEDFDRFVVEFAGADIPDYDVLYTNPPFFDEDGPIAVAGEAHVFVDLHPAPVEIWHEDGSTTLTYAGPARLTADTGNVTEVALGGGDEWTQWIIGVDHRAPLRVSTLDNPPRLVIDVGH